MKDEGFTAVLILVLVIIAGLVLVSTKFLENHQPKSINSSPLTITQDQNQDEPPLKLKSIGINFSDFKFTKAKLQFGRVFMPYGFFIPGSDATHPAKYNPQPTFVVPAETAVRSLVDGVVVRMPTLWSGDISIQVAVDDKSKWIYETEHVINPKVKVGDRVNAGQVIAEPSNFDKGAPEGFATVEIGILKGGQKPAHVCPFAYLDDSIRDGTLAEIKGLFKDWEEYVGNQSLYDESMPIPGCLTLDPIEG